MFQTARSRLEWPQIDEVFFGYLEKIARIVFYGFFGITILIGLVYQLLSITHPYSLDYGEAPLVDQALRMADGENIYRADLSVPPYTISNYPPVYIASLAPWVKLFGPVFWAGRLISTLSAYISALFLALIILTLTEDRLAAAAAGVAFLAIPYVTKWSSYLRIDMLALALSLAGLYLLTRHPYKRGSFLAGALLLVAAIFTRQSYALAAPLAAFTWFLLRDWRKALALAGVVGGVSLGLFLLLNLSSGGGFYMNIVTANVNEFGMDRLEWNLRDLRLLAPIFLILAGFSFYLAYLERKTWSLVAAYLVGAAISSLTIGKIGSNINYFLELCAAFGLVAGLCIAWSRRRQSSHVLRFLLLGLLVFQGTRLLGKTIQEYIPELAGRRVEIRQLQRLEEFVAEAQGPVLADEYMGMVLQAGRRLEIQPFEMTQLANAGIWDQAPLITRIEAKEYPLILLHDFGGYPIYKERWTGTMLEAIERSYRLSQQLAGSRIYVPRNDE